MTLPLGPVFLPVALEGSSDAHSGASEDDSGSEHSDEEDAGGDLEDGSGESTDVLGAPVSPRADRGCCLRNSLGELADFTTPASGGCELSG